MYNTMLRLYALSKLNHFTDYISNVSTVLNSDPTLIRNINILNDLGYETIMLPCNFEQIFHSCIAEVVVKMVDGEAIEIPWMQLRRGLEESLIIEKYLKDTEKTSVPGKDVISYSKKEAARKMKKVRLSCMPYMKLQEYAIELAFKDLEIKYNRQGHIMELKSTVYKNYNIESEKISDNTDSWSHCSMQYEIEQIKKQVKETVTRYMDRKGFLIIECKDIIKMLEVQLKSIKSELTDTSNINMNETTMKGMGTFQEEMGGPLKRIRFEIDVKTDILIIILKKMWDIITKFFNPVEFGLPSCVLVESISNIILGNEYMRENDAYFLNAHLLHDTYGLNKDMLINHLCKKYSINLEDEIDELESSSMKLLQILKLQPKLYISYDPYFFEGKKKRKQPADSGNERKKLLRDKIVDIIKDCIDKNKEILLNQSGIERIETIMYHIDMYFPDKLDDNMKLRGDCLDSGYENAYRDLNGIMKVIGPLK